MAKNDRPTSNAAPMTYTRVRRPNLRNQRVREGEPLSVPEAVVTTTPLDTTSGAAAAKKGGK